MFDYNKLFQAKITLTVVFFILFVLCYLLVKIYVYPPSPNDISYNNNNFSVLGLNIPHNLDFCGEKIPSNDYDIRRALEKEFYNDAYWKSNSIVLFHKAQRWFPYIEPILKEERVPDDFKYLAVIESHLSNATSPAGAAGFWQLVPFSARNYGLEVNSEVDERYHLEKATRAACKHIREAYSIFNNWTLSAAAYNRGIGGIQKAMSGQKANNYFDLLLNPETGSFVYRILAYKTLLSSPSHFGIKNQKWKYFPKIPYRVIKVDSSISDLSAFAKSIGCSKITLKVFNPWLVSNKLGNAAGKTYEIRIPMNPDADYTGYMKDLVPEDWGLSKEEEIAVLTQKNADSVITKVRKIEYVVKVDEPLESLSKFLKVKEEDLRIWNNLGINDNAVKGQTLIVNYPVGSN
jgi:membrane-bound lytic murein transglycosylase D